MVMRILICCWKASLRGIFWMMRVRTASVKGLRHHLVRIATGREGSGRNLLTGQMLWNAQKWGFQGDHRRFFEFCNIWKKLVFPRSVTRGNFQGIRLIKRLSEVTALSQDQYKVRENLHAGMIKKPLEPYHPNAFRSRLPQPTVVMPYKNSSQIVIGDRSTYYKRQFVSTNQNTFVKPKPFETMNPGIVSAKTIRGKHLQDL